MLKFVFFLCAFLLLSAVCADDASLTSIKNEYIHAINDGINVIIDRVLEIEKTTSEYVKKFREATVLDSQFINIKMHFAQIYAYDVMQVLKQTINVNVTECAKMADAFEQSIPESYAEAFLCFTDVTKDADVYIQHMSNSSENVLKNLADIKNEAEACIKNVRDTTVSIDALNCVNVAGAKEIRVINKQISSLYEELGKFQLKISDFITKWTICTNVNQVEKVLKSSSEIVQKVTQCVKVQEDLEDSKKSE